MLRDRLLRVPPIAAPAPGEPVAQVRASARIMLAPLVAFLSNGKQLHGTRQRNAASGVPCNWFAQTLPAYSVTNSA
jgi:hypothetical protein